MFVREQYKSRTDWLQGRRRYPGSSGASEAGTRIGVNKWQTIDELYDVATGIRHPKDLSNNRSVQFGVKAEEHIRNLVALDLHDSYTIEHYPYDILRMRSKPYIYCTLDGELTRKSDLAKGILEIKTGSYRSERDLDQWLTGIPDTYFAQVCQQFLVTGWAFAIVVARLKHEPIGGGIPSIKTYYRYFEREDKGVQMGMKAVEESSDTFHEAVIKRVRPATRIRVAI